MTRKIKPTTHIGGQLWKIISRIASGEAGVFEKTLEHFELDENQYGVLAYMEELRKMGHYDQKKQTSSTDSRIQKTPGQNPQ